MWNTSEQRPDRAYILLVRFVSDRRMWYRHLPVSDQRSGSSGAREQMKRAHDVRPALEGIQLNRVSNQRLEQCPDLEADTSTAGSHEK